MYTRFANREFRTDLEYVTRSRLISWCIFPLSAPPTLDNYCCHGIEYLSRYHKRSFVKLHLDSQGQLYLMLFDCVDDLLPVIRYRERLPLLLMLPWQPPKTVPGTRPTEAPIRKYMVAMRNVTVRELSRHCLLGVRRANSFLRVTVGGGGMGLCRGCAWQQVVKRGIGVQW